jgi:arylsulfatase A-like enzyme
MISFVVGSVFLEGQKLNVPIPSKFPTGPPKRDAGYWHYPRYHQSTPNSVIIYGRYKLIHFYEDNRDELYDLESDIGERFNIAEGEPTLTEELQEKLNTWPAKKDAAIPQLSPGFDEQKQLIWGTHDRDTWSQQYALPE